MSSRLSSLIDDNGMKNTYMCVYMSREREKGVVKDVRGNAPMEIQRSICAHLQKRVRGRRRRDWLRSDVPCDCQQHACVCVCVCVCMYDCSAPVEGADRQRL